MSAICGSAKQHIMEARRNIVIAVHASRAGEVGEYLRRREADALLGVFRAWSDSQLNDDRISEWHDLHHQDRGDPCRRWR